MSRAIAVDARREARVRDVRDGMVVVVFQGVNEFFVQCSETVHLN